MDVSKASYRKIPCCKCPGLIKYNLPDRFERLQGGGITEKNTRFGGPAEANRNSSRCCYSHRAGTGDHLVQQLPASGMTGILFKKIKVYPESNYRNPNNHGHKYGADLIRKLLHRWFFDWAD
jgi:hypothetical protein